MTSDGSGGPGKIELGHPTPLWIDGLPMGNGDIGVVLYGTPEHLSLTVNKSDVWDHRIGRGQGLPEDKTTFDEMVATAKRHDFKAYDRFFADWLEREDCAGPSLQTCGQLDLDLLPGERVLGIKQELDLSSARARIVCDCSVYREKAQAYTLDTFVPAGDSVIPVAIANIPGRELFGKLHLWRQASIDYGSPAAWCDGDIAGLDMTIPESIGFTIAVRVIGRSGRWEVTSTDAVYSVDPDVAPVRILMTVVSSADAADTRRAALDRLHKASVSGVAERVASEHDAWWADFWSRSSVQLPDAELERQWHLGLYLFGCSSRPGRKAPGLQGIWNKYTRPAWHTDYHADGNIEIIYWSSYSSNHLDLAEPFYRLFAVEMADEARRAARDFFKRRGMYIPIAGGPRGHELASPWAWPGAGAWIALHFWWHWLYSQDKEFLRRAYPFLKELSLFHEDFLTRNEQGVYEFGPSFSPETRDPRAWLMMAWGKNVTCDLAFVRVLLTALIEGSEILGVDRDDRVRWREIRDNLAPYPVADGMWLDLEGGDWPVLEPDVSIPRIVPVWPACDVGIGSPPELQAVARRSLERVVPMYGRGGHCGLWCAAASAHLGLAAEAMTGLKSCIAGREPNGFSPMMQIDSVLGLPAVVNELLLQSLDGVIRIFPAVPADWVDVSFTTLLAAGAFLVSARRNGGRTSWVRISSRAGCACVLHNPFERGRVRLTGPDGSAELSAGADGCLRFATKAGASYELTA